RSLAATVALSTPGTDCHHLPSPAVIAAGFWIPGGSGGISGLEKRVVGFRVSRGPSRSGLQHDKWREGGKYRREPRDGGLLFGPGHSTDSGESFFTGGGNFRERPRCHHQQSDMEKLFWKPRGCDQQQADARRTAVRDCGRV